MHGMIFSLFHKLYLVIGDISKIKVLWLGVKKYFIIGILLIYLLRV